MIREFHLSPTGEGLGISCDAKGAFIGAIPILKKLRKNGRDEWDLRDCEQLSEEISEHYGLPIDMSSKTGGLKVIANALNEGDVARAQIGAVLLGIPNSLSLTKGVPSHDQMIKLIGDLHWSGLLNWGPDGVLEKAGYNPDEPRDQRGRWTNEGDATVEANVAGRDPRTQLADLGISDASDDPIADAARTAARIDSDHKTSDGDNAPNMVLAAAESEDEKEPRSANELIPQRLQRSPAGPAVEFLDNLLDISGPGDEANLEMGQLLMDNLLHEIRKIDPNYVDSSIWPPGELAGMTWQERQSVISRYQAVLAAKIYGARGDIRPLQEVISILCSGLQTPHIPTP